jgi:hypothetical protein
MGLAGFPSFLQHRLERLFRDYLRRFVAVYIDDIIVFSPTPEQHLQDLDTVLGLLESSGVTLNLTKCTFA